MAAAVIRTDITAALTAVALLAPETVAFAQLAGVPPAQALAAAPLCVLAWAVLGRSPRLVVGATAATAVITSAAVVGRSADPAHRAALAVALTILAGGVLLVTGLLRFGFVARFLAPEALRGFLFGLAVVIVVRQVAAMLDVHTRTGNVFVRGWDIAAAAPEWSIPSLVTGLVALGALWVLETRLPRVPATLIVLSAAAVSSAVLHLKANGVPHVAAVPAGLPRPALPALGLHEWLSLAPEAAGLALIVFVLGHGVAAGVRGTDEPPVDANREMTALGVGNLLAGLVGGLAVTGSPSATSAAAIAGGRTRWLQAASTVLLLAVAVALAPAFALLPEPVLAAVVIMAVRPFLTVRPLRAYWASDRRALAVAASAVLGVATLTLIPGLLIAVALSLVIYVADAGRLRVSELGRSPGGAYLDTAREPGLLRPPGATILRPDGQLFFANVERLSAAVDAELARPDRDGDALVLDLAASFELRSGVLAALADIRRKAAQAGRPLALAHLYLDARDAVAASDLADVPSYRTLDAAVAAPPVQAGMTGSAGS